MASRAASCGLRSRSPALRLGEEIVARAVGTVEHRSGWRWRRCRSVRAPGWDWPCEKPECSVSARTASSVAGPRRGRPGSSNHLSMTSGSSP